MLSSSSSSSPPVASASASAPSKNKSKKQTDKTTWGRDKALEGVTVVVRNGSTGKLSGDIDWSEQDGCMTWKVHYEDGTVDWLPMDEWSEETSSPGRAPIPSSGLGSCQFTPNHNHRSGKRSAAAATMMAKPTASTNDKENLYRDRHNSSTDTHTRTFHHHHNDQPTLNVGRSPLRLKKNASRPPTTAAATKMAWFNNQKRGKGGHYNKKKNENTSSTTTTTAAAAAAPVLPKEWKKVDESIMNDEMRLIEKKHRKWYFNLPTPPHDSRRHRNTETLVSQHNNNNTTSNTAAASAASASAVASSSAVGSSKSSSRNKQTLKLPTIPGNDGDEDDSNNNNDDDDDDYDASLDLTVNERSVSEQIMIQANTELRKHVEKLKLSEMTADDVSKCRDKLHQLLNIHVDMFLLSSSPMLLLEETVEELKKHPETSSLAHSLIHKWLNSAPLPDDDDDCYDDLDDDDDTTSDTTKSVEGSSLKTTMTSAKNPLALTDVSTNTSRKSQSTKQASSSFQTERPATVDGNKENRDNISPSGSPGAVVLEAMNEQQKGNGQSASSSGTLDIDDKDVWNDAIKKKSDEERRRHHRRRTPRLSSGWKVCTCNGVEWNGTICETCGGTRGQQKSPPASCTTASTIADNKGSSKSSPTKGIDGLVDSATTSSGVVLSPSAPATFGTAEVVATDTIDDASFPVPEDDDWDKDNDEEIEGRNDTTSKSIEESSLKTTSKKRQLSSSPSPSSSSSSSSNKTSGTSSSNSSNAFILSSKKKRKDLTEVSTNISLQRPDYDNNNNNNKDLTKSTELNTRKDFEQRPVDNNDSKIKENSAGRSVTSIDEFETMSELEETSGKENMDSLILSPKSPSPSEFKRLYSNTTSSTTEVIVAPNTTNACTGIDTGTGIGAGSGTGAAAGTDTGTDTGTGTGTGGGTRTDDNDAIVFFVDDNNHYKEKSNCDDDEGAAVTTTNDNDATKIDTLKEDGGNADGDDDDSVCGMCPLTDEDQKAPTTEVIVATDKANARTSKKRDVKSVVLAKDDKELQYANALTRTSSLQAVQRKGGSQRMKYPAEILSPQAAQRSYSSECTEGLTGRSSSQPVQENTAKINTHVDEKKKEKSNTLSCIEKSNTVLQPNPAATAPRMTNVLEVNDACDDAGVANDNYNSVFGMCSVAEKGQKETDELDEKSKQSQAADDDDYDDYGGSDVGLDDDGYDEGISGEENRDNISSFGSPSNNDDDDDDDDDEKDDDDVVGRPSSSPTTVSASAWASASTSECEKIGEINMSPLAAATILSNENDEKENVSPLVNMDKKRATESSSSNSKKRPARSTSTGIFETTSSSGTSMKRLAECSIANRKQPRKKQATRRDVNLDKKRPAESSIASRKKPRKKQAKRQDHVRPNVQPACSTSGQRQHLNKRQKKAAARRKAVTSGARQVTRRDVRAAGTVIAVSSGNTCLPDAVTTIISTAMAADPSFHIMGSDGKNVSKTALKGFVRSELSREVDEHGWSSLGCMESFLKAHGLEAVQQNNPSKIDILTRQTGYYLIVCVLEEADDKVTRHAVSYLADQRILIDSAPYVPSLMITDDDIKSMTKPDRSKLTNRKAADKIFKHALFGGATNRILYWYEIIPVKSSSSTSKPSAASSRA